MRQKIQEEINKVLKKLYPEYSDVSFDVSVAAANIDADYASNVALILAKQVGKKPMEIAEEIASQMSNVKCQMFVANPGFLNFKLSSEFLSQNLNEILEKKEKYGSSDLGKGGKALVEYFQLNLGKPPHVGHLRSAVIGDSLKRILIFVGYETVSDTHVGDWGTQFGILLWAYKNLRQGEVDGLDKLNHLYIEANKQIENDESIRDQAKAEFVLLEQGDHENRELWEKFVKLSRAEFVRSADMLGLLPFDYDLGESFYEDKMPEILKKLEEKQLITIGETGEKYVDLEKFNLGRLICVKSDGATTYEMRDLATVAYRYDELGPLVWNLYVVDSRQAHDFRQVFKVMNMLGYDMTKSLHADFGFMKLPEGAISTRKGNAISLDALIQEAEKRALGIINDKNPDLKDKENTAKAVAIAAIKYGDLKHNRKSDIIFDWDEAVSFEGNTGPYIQYTHARLRSILRKADMGANASTKVNLEPAERQVLRKMVYFPEIIQESAESFLPSHLATYLYELAGDANTFYQEVPVLAEEDEKKREFRLALVSATAQVLANGLELLGIKALEEM